MASTGSDVHNNMDVEAIKIKDSANNPITVQNPFETKDQSVYPDDVKSSLNNNGTFTGDLLTLFNNLDDSITDVSATNPKYFEIFLERPQRTGSVGLIAKTGSFSNVKIIFKDRQGTVISTVDDSTNNTAYTSHKYTESYPENACCIRFEFHTANSITLSFVYLRKIDTVNANIQGTRIDGTRGFVPLMDDNSMSVTNTPYLYAIAEGDVPFHRTLDKYGKVANVNTTETDVWTVGGTYVFPSAAAQVWVISTSANDTSAGTGVRTVFVKGLDANYAEISETITMNGVTAVQTVNSYLRINNLYALTTGTGLVSAGTITCQSTNVGGNIYRSIPTGYTQDRSLVYTTPAGFTGFIANLSFSAGVGGNTVKVSYNTFTLRRKCTSDFVATTFFLPILEIGVINGAIDMPLETPIKIPEKTDFKVSVIGDYAGGTTCIAQARGWLDPNN